MGEMGKRAAEAVREKARETEILRKMCLAGYDIVYILTGVKK